MVKWFAAIKLDLSLDKEKVMKF